MKHMLSQPRQGHSHGGAVRAAGTALATGLAFTAMAPATNGIFHGISAASAQTQTSYYNPKTEPFEADQTIRDLATLIMGSAPDTRGRVKALFDMLNTGSPTGLKALLRADRPPRTAIKTVQESGDCGELASVILAVIAAMNAQGAGIEADAVVVHFHDAPPDDEHMIARAKVGGTPVIIDPQAAALGVTKEGSYDVDLTLTAHQAAEMYHREYGDYLRKQGNAKEAMEAYKRAVGIFNGDSYVHLGLGRLYENANEMEAARAQFVIADSLSHGAYSPSRKRGDYNQEIQAGEAAYNAKDWNACAKHYQKALELCAGLKHGHEDSLAIMQFINDCGGGGK